MGNQSTIATAGIAAVASILVAIITTCGTIHASDNKLAKNQQAIANLSAQAEAIQAASAAPIGTVLASMLQPPAFATAVGDPPNFEIGHSKWTLADDKGRIPGTKWAEYTQNAPVPDLRGMFIRGINQGRSDGKQDPDNRNPGDYQVDQFQTHIHDALYANHAGTTPSHKYEGASDQNPAGKTAGPATGRYGSETRPKNVAVFFYLRIN